MLVLADLDDTTVERAGALVANEHAAARRICPELTATYVDAATCAAALQRLRAAGARRHYLLHTPLPRLDEGSSNLGFGRDGCYGVQPAAAGRPSSNITVRVAAERHLDTIARLARVEIEHRSAAPMFEPPATPS
jgi:hypothetical protein